MSTPPLGLYIHLPWCERKCPYCDFNSHERSEVPESAYVAALLRDLEQDLTLVPEREISSIFIGGGTPSLFSGAGIAALLQGVAARAVLSHNCETTMEANPGSAEADRFRDYRGAGVSRLSLGIQSFDDDCLHRLGRVHSSVQARRAIDYAVAAGFDRINLDLMHGLPGQSVDAALRDLRIAIDCDPGHLSWYQLTIEANTAFYKRPPTLPTEDRLADIQERGEHLLTRSGYVQYEVSAWSRQHQQCRHNRNYWTFGDYLGIGAGAHGKLSLADGSVRRYAKRRQPDDYLAAAPGRHTAAARSLQRNELGAEFVMNALRLNEGFSTGLFRARTGLDTPDLEPALGNLVARDLLQQCGETIRTTALGRRFLDDVVAEFFTA